MRVHLAVLAALILGAILGFGAGGGLTANPQQQTRAERLSELDDFAGCFPEQRYKFPDELWAATVRACRDFIEAPR